MCSILSFFYPLIREEGVVENVDCKITYIDKEGMRHLNSSLLELHQKCISSLDNNSMYCGAEILCGFPKSAIQEV